MKVNREPNLRGQAFRVLLVQVQVLVVVRSWSGPGSGPGSGPSSRTYSSPDSGLDSGSGALVLEAK